MKIGIIGSGISGLTCATILSEKHEITLFEKNNYFGGHSNTINVNSNELGKFSVDTGFIVYNKTNYPNFSKFLNFLDINSYKSNMSFSISIDDGKLEYSGSILGLIANYKNFFNKEYFLILRDIFRFFNYGFSYKIQNSDKESLESYLDRCNFSKSFRDYHLIPMASAIWSTNEKDILKFPINTMLDFFKNHQLLNFVKRPLWETISGGSAFYVSKILSILKSRGNQLYLNKKITKLKKIDNKIILIDENEKEYDFDCVVFANHTDQACKILIHYDKEYEKTLKNFRFQPNTTYLHSDKELMPKNKLTWSSWNYLYQSKNKKSCVTYWMNKLQSLNTSKDIFVTLNPIIKPKDEKIIKVINYSHPIFDFNSVKTQKKVNKLQGQNKIFFAGAWNGYGFHEDGVNSALNVCKLLDIEPSWINL